MYFAKYREIALTISYFHSLKDRLKAGENLQINEVDGPTYAQEYPYNQTVDGSILMDAQILKVLIENLHPQGGKQGYFESHINSIKQAYDEGCQNILIFEDDLEATDFCTEEQLYNVINLWRIILTTTNIINSNYI